MNFDDIIKNSFETEAADLKVSSSRHMEMLNTIEARGQAKKRGIGYRISRLFSKMNFVEALEVVAFAAVLIAVPFVGTHFKNINMKVDNNTTAVQKDNSLQLSKDINTGAGVIVTITPIKNKINSVKISDQDMNNLMEEATKDKVKAISINNIKLTEKSSFEDHRAEGYVLVDGSKILLNANIIVKIIGNKDKLYNSLMSEQIVKRTKQWGDIKVEKADSITIDSLEPQEVVENYFKYMNVKNKEKLLENLTEEYKAANMVWGFENLDYIKILNLEEETDPTQKNGYLTNGKGKYNGTKEENLKVFRVNYEVKYKDDNVGPQPSGKYIWWFFVIRENSSSPWIISEFGV